MTEYLTSIAFSALVSWITPTVAFAINISRITAGSTNAEKIPPSLLSSKRARTNETTADARRISTSWSLNCSKMSSQRGVEASSGNSVQIICKFISSQGFRVAFGLPLRPYS